MYAFPKIELTSKPIKNKAKLLGVKPDFLYCMELLKETGIMVVPGSGFGQKEGTYHFRITNLINPSSEMKRTLSDLNAFNTNFHDRY